MTELDRAAVEYYLHAREYVHALGFGAEISWQERQDPKIFDESALLREAAWVILCTGFRESTVRARFSTISLCFCDWASAQEIAQSADVCRRTALSCLANKPKIDAIVSVALVIALSGFEGVRARILEDPISALQRFDYIGEVTAFHLAKNLGFQVVKPDRHLVRLADRLGFSDVSGMCCSISEATGDCLNAVDITLWRYCVLGQHH